MTNLFSSTCRLISFIAPSSVFLFVLWKKIICFVSAGTLYMEVDAYFWLLYTTSIIFVTLIFSVIPLTGNILSFTILGAFTSVLSIDYFANSNLKYILVNSIRRISVDNFKVAVINPPYQDNGKSWNYFQIYFLFFYYCEWQHTNCRFRYFTHRFLVIPCDYWSLQTVCNQLESCTIPSVFTALVSWLWKNSPAGIAKVSSKE